MSHHYLTSACALATVIVLLAPVPVAGQTQTGAPTTTPPANSWTSPRTPDGQPDIQGAWNFSTATPMERLAKYEGRAFLTSEEEAEVVEGRRIQDLKYNQPKEGSTGTYNQFWIDRGTDPVSTKRTSLVIDPPDGRFPPLTSTAEQRQAWKVAAREGRGSADSWEDRNLGERCIMAFNTGHPMIPRLYNNNVQIVQGPDYMVILTEQIHQARIVPLDGPLHLDSSIRLSQGDSRGHWEGDALVVDTTNFTDKLEMGLSVDPSIRGFNAEPSEAFHLIERFTLTDADTLLYQFTVDDPVVWTAPWTVEIPMTRESGIFEYACHEGNRSMEVILSGARADEKAAEEAATK